MKATSAFAALAAAFGILCSCSTEQALTQARSSHMEVVDQAIFMVLPYTVDNVRTGGTGFLIETKKFGKVIITNKHVCDALDEFATYPSLEQGQAEFPARLIAKSTTTDLCMIRAPGEVARTRKALPLAKEGPRQGDHVCVHGHPYLRPVNEWTGKYVNEAEEPIGLDGLYSPDSSFLVGRIDFMIFPGNSGSPILNERGEVIGVIFAYETRTRNGLFIPLSELLKFIEETP